MKTAKIGKQEIPVSEIGLGCMGMSEFYGSANDAESLKTLDRSLELGMFFWDTADIYGPFKNEELISKALKDRREKITLATKFGIVRDPANPQARGLNGSREYAHSSCEASLKRLQTEYIDLYYLHRVDPNTPIEETVGGMAELVKQGKIRSIGLSEVSAATLRRAHAVHPITAVQSEYSLWSRDPEDELIDTCRELGVCFVAYSPLGRGFLSGQIRKYEDFAQDDFRRNQPRFMGENFKKNLELADRLGEMAKEKNCTPSQLALAWVLAKGEHIVPIPGTKRIRYLEENAAAVDIHLSSGELSALEAVVPRGAVAGTRYTEAGMKIVDQ